MDMEITFEQMPAVLSQLLAKIERIEHFTCNQSQTSAIKQQPKFVDINGAAEITSKTPNALRIQISLGNLKSIKKGSRNYFDREYLENWLAGNLNEKGLLK